MTEETEITFHLTSCNCPSCAGQSFSSEAPAFNFGNAGPTVTSEDLVMSNSTADYIRSLFGTDSAVWSNGGFGSAAFGNAVTIGYTFGNVSWANPFGYSGGSAFDAAEQNAALAAMQMWANVANITFVSTSTAAAKLAFHNYDLAPGVGGQAVTWAWNDNGGDVDRIAQSEVTMDISMSGYTAGQYGWLAMIHEIGHALGLKHPGNYNAGGGGSDGPYLTDTGLIDSQDFSVMSYYQGVYADGTPYASTPMLYDIAAIQYLYGANHSYNSGNTTYTLTNTANAFTIWDGAGNDTLNSTSYNGNVTLDLREGEAYVSHVGNSHSWVAFGANIENASSGGGNDTLYGNSLANILNGGGGNDTLYGGAGNDTLYGGAGTDTYSFTGSGGGSNTIIDSDGLGILKIDGITVAGNATGAGGSYSLLAGGATFNLTQNGSGGLAIAKAGGSTLATIVDFFSGLFNIFVDIVSGIFGGGGNDSIKDTTGDDELYGLAGNDKITSKYGQDTISGGDGHDNISAKGAGAEVYGDAGNDIIKTYGPGSYIDGGDGNDVLEARGANSTVDGGAGDDTITARIYGEFNGGDGNDLIKAKTSAIMNGDDGNDRIDGSKLNDTIDGGDGNDVIYASKGNDLIYTGDGNDQVYGDYGNDTIVSGGGTNFLYGGRDTDTYQLAAGDGVDTIYYYDMKKDVTAVAGANSGYERVTNFEEGVDQFKFAGKYASAWDDISKDGNFTFAVDAPVNFATTHEAWLVTGFDDADLTQAGFVNLLAALNGLGITSIKKADGLIAVEGDTQSALFSYLENGASTTSISASELTFIALIDGTIDSSSFDF